MAKTTVCDALRVMQHLVTASAGRLDGINLLHDAWRMSALGSGAPGWPDDLNVLLADRAAGTVTGDTPVYIVCSDGFPVCWLTYDAVTVVPTADLSRNQIKHRDLAVVSLAGLARHVLGQLADLRDVRDGRPEDVDAGYRTDRHGMARVAGARCPARAWWVQVGADLPETERRTSAATRLTGDEVLILAAHGYGEYGRRAHRVQLDVLCAINAAAEAHQLPGSVVGDWLAGEGGLAPGRIPADEVAPAFAEAYVGVFNSERAYVAALLELNGWEAALRQLGALEFFDTAAYRQYLFSREVRAITNSAGGGIVVCRRHAS